MVIFHSYVSLPEGIFLLVKSRGLPIATPSKEVPAPRLHFAAEGQRGTGRARPGFVDRGQVIKDGNENLWKQLGKLESTSIHYIGRHFLYPKSPLKSFKHL